jgi:hypothetical protein
MDKHAKYYSGRVTYGTNGFGPHRQYNRSNKGNSCGMYLLFIGIIAVLLVGGYFAITLL